MSVDPVTFMDTGNPAQFNRYSYTWNDPINGFDPDGRETRLMIEAKHLDMQVANGSMTLAQRNQISRSQATGAALGLGGIGTGLAVRAIASRFLLQGIAGAEIAGGAIAGEFGAVGLGLGGGTTAAVLHSGNEIVSASKNAAQSLTSFGKQFTKHAGQQRPSGTFPALSGSNSQINQQAADIAESILTNPASRTFDEATGTTIVRNEAGQGVRYVEETKKFIGFLD